MSWNRTDGIGGQGITEVSTVQNHPWGYRVTAQHPTYGQGEFVYVKGVSSGAAGLFASYNQESGVTALTVARTKGLVGVMMSTLDANTKFGWLQVRGVAQGQTAGDVGAGATVYSTATGGKVDDAVTAGDIVYGANFAASRTGAGAVSVSLDSPFMGDTDNT
jgi:hypothetical protein